MYELLAVLSGVIIAVMIQINGGFSALVGPWHSTLLIHAVGLVGVILILLARRKRVRIFQKQIPWVLYCGGVIGVATVVINNITTLSIGVLATLSLGLLGQIVLSLFIEHYGLLGTPKRPINSKKLGVIGLICGGIGVMQFWGSGLQNAPVLIMVLAFLCGGVIVLNRIMNAGLGQFIGVMPSTLMNYITGLATSFVIVLLVAEPAPANLLPATPQQALLYTGGLLGICAVSISSIVAVKLPSLQVTLYVFVSQLCAGMLLDYLFFSNFSFSQLAGGVFVLAGLVLNQLLEAGYQKQKNAPIE